MCRHIWLFTFSYPINVIRTFVPLQKERKEGSVGTTSYIVYITHLQFSVAFFLYTKFQLSKSSKQNSIQIIRLLT